MNLYDKSRLPKYLWSYNKNHNFNELVVNHAKIKKAYQNLLEKTKTTPIYLPNLAEIPSSLGRLIIDFEQENTLQKSLSNILIFKPDNSDFLRVYPGKSRNFYPLEKSIYNMVFLYEDNQYHTIDSISILPNGSNYLKIKIPEILKSDEYGTTLNSMINERYQKELGKDINNQITLTKEAYQSLSEFNSHKLRVSGIVTGIDDNFPLPGVNVIVKGTSRGAQTDFDGLYSLLVNSGDVLVFSYVGYETVEVMVRQQEINIEMSASNSLEEVVLTGYITQRFSRPKTRSVASNEIKSSMSTENGITNTGQPSAMGYGTNITIRGLAGISDINQPLFIVNGMIFRGKISQIENNQIKSIKVLNQQDATQMFGIKGKNGAVLIELEKDALLSTLKTQNENTVFDEMFFQNTYSTNSLRQNYSDAAFWQPKLKTDQNGQASFEVTFPDDVTNWETFYLAMNGNKQSGQVRKSIKSYKPLMAQLAVPRFLVENDTTYAIGKTLNYSPEEQEINITYEINDVVQFSKKELFENAVIDTLMIIAKDSISAKYIIEKADGYFDGELRKIPVYPKGLYQTHGNFYVLDKNETIDLSFNPDYGKVKLYARADILEVFEEEINHVIRYKYLCNEQVASKLKMLLMQKKLAAYKNLPFKNEKDIDKLISLLLKNQKSSGVWGWWRDSHNSYWISLHVLEALALAKNEGYSFVLNIASTTQDMIWRLENSSNFDETYRILKALKLLDAKVDYKNYTEKLGQKEKINFNERLKLTELQQLNGINYQLDSIIKNKRSTLFDNIYFAENESVSNLLNNNIQNTILAYKILKADTLDFSAELSKIRNFFFERRNSGYWRNTFESAQIIETIIDDFIQMGSKPKTPKLKIEGDISSVVETFPFEMNVEPNQKISVSKTGDFPVYFTSYQSFWERNPTENKGDFEISTQFGLNNLSVLKGGEEVTLFVNVKLRKDAEYVMINVPILAGCSYGDNRNNNSFESHRESFKNETAIFCERLPAGEHTFEINLIPRYSGSYTLNPALIELMYFPIFNANNSLEKIIIR